jgi:hypothetical protein
LGNFPAQTAIPAADRFPRLIPGLSQITLSPEPISMAIVFVSAPFKHAEILLRITVHGDHSDAACTGQIPGARTAPQAVDVINRHRIRLQRSAKKAPTTSILVASLLCNCMPFHRIIARQDRINNPSFMPRMFFTCSPTRGIDKPRL